MGSVSRYGTVVGVTSGGTVGWVSNGDYKTATSSSSGAVTTNYLRCRDFGFETSDFPSGTEITGIEIDFICGRARNNSSTNYTVTKDIRLVIGGTNRTKTDGSDKWPVGSSTSTFYYGSSSDKWGASTISVSDICTSGTTGFRCELRADIVSSLTTGGYGSVDTYDFYCTVYYKDPATPATVNNNEITNLTTSSVTLNSNLNLRDYNRVRNFTWHYRLFNFTTLSSINDGTITTSGNKTKDISGLTSNRWYVYGGYYDWIDSDAKTSYFGTSGNARFITGDARTNADGGVGGYLTFITRVYPSTTILDATNITQNSATLNLNYSSKGSYNAIIVEWYFREGTSGTWTLLEKAIRSSTGTQTLNKSGLSPNTTYQYYCKINRRSIDLYPVVGSGNLYVRHEDVINAGVTKTYEFYDKKDYEVTNLFVGTSGGKRVTRFMINGELTGDMFEGDEILLSDNTLFHVFLISTSGSAPVNFYMVGSDLTSSEYQNSINTDVKTFTTISPSAVYYNIGGSPTVFKKINEIWYNVPSIGYKKINQIYYNDNGTWRKVHG